MISSCLDAQRLHVAAESTAPRFYPRLAKVLPRIPLIVGSRAHPKILIRALAT
jgi:hypothetical protein